MHKCFKRALVVAVFSILCSGALAGPIAHIESRLSLHMSSDDGGFSGLELNEDGTHAIILSDRGTLVQGTIHRNGDGVATAFSFGERQRLRHDGEKNHPDSEGLALGPNGFIFVSSEDPTRILKYVWDNKFPHYLPTVPTDRALDTNRGFEALAITSRGSLVTLFETPDTFSGTYEIFQHDTGVWTSKGHLPSTPNFSVVGADFGPDKRLYLLERAFSPLGFRTQIRRVTFREDQVDIDTVFGSRLGEFDNLEGIAISKTPTGLTRITLISDDNFLSFLRTELIELHVEE